MEIDITDLFEQGDFSLYYGSILEKGPDAGKITWKNAMEEAEARPILTTEDQLDALRQQMRDYGAWTGAEIDAWTPQECNAIFIQLVSGDAREAGFDDFDVDWDDDDDGNIFKGSDGRIYYYLGS